MRRLAHTGMLAVMLLGLAISSAYATPMLRLTIGSTTVATITDQGSGDVNPVVGAVTYVYVGTLWSLNVSTGITKPVDGDAIQAYVHLDSVSTSTSAGTLKLEFMETHFGPLPTNWNFFAKLSAVLSSGSINYQAFWDQGNGNFALTNLLTDLTLSGGGGFATASSAAVPVANYPYSITQVVTLNHTASGTSSFDADLRATPEPSALILFGSGLAAIGLWRLRKRA